MTPDQRKTALTLLAESADAFQTAITGLTRDQWMACPHPNGWSIAQISEHIVLAETALFRKVQSLLATPPLPDPVESTPEQLASMRKILAGRQGRVPAPAALHPKATWSQPEILRQFLAHRETLRLFVDTNTQSLDYHVADNAFFGPLSAFHWLIYAPLHTQRHILQIRELTTP